MDSRFKAMHARVMRQRRRLLAFARDYPDHEDAELFTRAAEECRVFSEHIKLGKRPAPEMPALSLVIAGESMAAEFDLQRFKRGQEAFSK